MLKGLGVIAVVGFLGLATIGLAGGGPVWLRYVGAGTIFLMLLLILGIVSGIPSKQELAQRVVRDAQSFDRGAPREIPFDSENPRAQKVASRLDV